MALQRQEQQRAMVSESGAADWLYSGFFYWGGALSAPLIFKGRRLNYAPPLPHENIARLSPHALRWHDPTTLTELILHSPYSDGGHSRPDGPPSAILMLKNKPVRYKIIKKEGFYLYHQ